MDELEGKKKKLLSLLRRGEAKDSSFSKHAQFKMRRKIVLGQIDLIENQITTLSRLDMISQEQAHEREEMLRAEQQKILEEEELLELKRKSQEAKRQRAKAEAFKMVISEEVRKLAKKNQVSEPKARGKKLQQIGELMIDQQKKWQQGKMN